MLGLDVLNKVYTDKSLSLGTIVISNDNKFIVEDLNEKLVLREFSVGPHPGKTVHNYSFKNLMEFSSSTCTIEAKKVSFSEAARINKKMTHTLLADVNYMSTKQALLYLSSINNNKLLKSLLEDEVWIV